MADNAPEVWHDAAEERHDAPEEEHPQEEEERPGLGLAWARLAPEEEHPKEEEERPGLGLAWAWAWAWARARLAPEEEHPKEPEERPGALAVEGPLVHPGRAALVEKNRLPCPALRKIIGTKKGERVSYSQVKAKVWAYLREKGLQDPLDRNFFHPDNNMKPIFGSERQRCFGMGKKFNAHLVEVEEEGPQ